MRVKDIVGDRNRIAKFSYFCGGNLYYTVEMDDGTYQFPVNVDFREVGTAVFDKEIRAITLMRYIRKAIEKEELIKIN